MKTFCECTLLITLLVVTDAPATRSTNILGVFPTKTASHFKLGWALMHGLAEAGHNVTLISPYEFPKRDIGRNSIETQIHLIYLKDTTFFTGENKLSGINNTPMKLLRESIGSTRHTLESQSVQELLNSITTKFDVIVMEEFLNDALLGLGDHFKAPIVAFSPFGATRLTNQMVGSPSPVEYVPHVTLSFTDRMTFVQRIINTLTTMTEFVFINLWYHPSHEKLLFEFFGPNTPSLSALQTNVSLVLLNTHFILNYPRPYMSNMIEIGGFHIQSDASRNHQLPKRLQRFLDEADEGVIYFSMGSILRCSEIPSEKMQALRRVFGSLSQRVLWKCDEDKKSKFSPNVMVSKWFPQEAILEHKNVRLFITHGGLLSSMEAVYFGVPIIGIPIYGDQYLNVAKAVSAGYGMLLRYDNLTEQSLSWAVDEMLATERYRTHMQRTSQRFRDQPNHPLKTAIYWVEYVARHQGAPQLQSSGRLLGFWAGNNLDVYAVFAGVTFGAMMLIKILIRKLRSQLRGKVLKQKTT